MKWLLDYCERNLAGVKKMVTTKENKVGFWCIPVALAVCRIGIVVSLVLLLFCYYYCAVAAVIVVAASSWVLLSDSRISFRRFLVSSLLHFLSSLYLLLVCSCLLPCSIHQFPFSYASLETTLTMITMLGWDKDGENTRVY